MRVAIGIQWKKTIEKSLQHCYRLPAGLLPPQPCWQHAAGRKPTWYLENMNRSKEQNMLKQQEHIKASPAARARLILSKLVPLCYPQYTMHETSNQWQIRQVLKATSMYNHWKSSWSFRHSTCYVETMDKAKERFLSDLIKTVLNGVNLRCL